MDLLFLNICKSLEIQEAIAKKWLDQIKSKMTSESQRHYHNWDNFIDSKYKFVENLENVCVILAIFFQYYEFDVRRNCVEENCRAFQEFAQESNLKDVSCDFLKNISSKDVMNSFLGCFDKENEETFGRCFY